MLILNIKDLLTVSDLNSEEINKLLELARDIKQNWLNYTKALEHMRLGLLFENPSTRTRVSFEIGIKELGGHSIFLKSEELQLNRGESMVDTAKTLERYVDYLTIRTDSHSTLEVFAENTKIPIINALSDLYHPCQALSDVFTMKEMKKEVNKIAYIGDGNNVCNSLMGISSILNLNLVVATPKNHEPPKNIKDKYPNVPVINDPKEAAREADVIYTDTWISMHQQDQSKKIEAFKDFQINSELVSLANEDYLFMHCLPAYRGKEVTSEVLDSQNSVVYDQAENRLHVQKALLIGLKKKKFRGYKVWF